MSKIIIKSPEALQKLLYRLNPDCFTGSHQANRELLLEAFGEESVEKWMPKDQEGFLFINSSFCLEIVYFRQDNKWIPELIKSGNCFPNSPEGRAEAEAKLDKIKEILAK